MLPIARWRPAGYRARRAGSTSGGKLHLAQRLYHGWVTVVEAQVGPGVQRGDSRYILRAELHVENVEVLGDTLRAGRFGDGYDFALDEPAQIDLRDSPMRCVSHPVTQYTPALP
jgi:hypothetical protein